MTAAPPTISAAYEMTPKGDGTFIAKPCKPVQWIRAGTAAKMLGVSRWTAIRWIKSGHIKGRRIGPKHWQVDSASLSECPADNFIGANGADGASGAE